MPTSTNKFWPKFVLPPLGYSCSPLPCTTCGCALVVRTTGTVSARSFWYSHQVLPMSFPITHWRLAQSSAVWGKQQKTAAVKYFFCVCSTKRSKKGKKRRRYRTEQQSYRAGESVFLLCASPSIVVSNLGELEQIPSFHPPLVSCGSQQQRRRPRQQRQQQQQNGGRERDHPEIMLAQPAAQKTVKTRRHFSSKTCGIQSYNDRKLPDLDVATNVPQLLLPHPDVVWLISAIVAEHNVRDLGMANDDCPNRILFSRSKTRFSSVSPVHNSLNASSSRVQCLSNCTRDRGEFLTVKQVFI